MKNQNFLGEQLKKIMFEKKLTQKEVADKIGVEQTVISRWARGAAEPTLASVKKLAEVFGVGLNYFLENYENKKVEKTKILNPEEENLKLTKELLNELKEIKNILEKIRPIK